MSLVVVSSSLKSERTELFGDFAKLILGGFFTPNDFVTRSSAMFKGIETESFKNSNDSTDKYRQAHNYLSKAVRNLTGSSGAPKNVLELALDGIKDMYSGKDSRRLEEVWPSAEGVIKDKILLAMWSHLKEFPVSILVRNPQLTEMIVKIAHDEVIGFSLKSALTSHIEYLVSSNTIPAVLRCLLIPRVVSVVQKIDKSITALKLVSANFNMTCDDREPNVDLILPYLSGDKKFREYFFPAFPSTLQEPEGTLNSNSTTTVNVEASTQVRKSHGADSEPTGIEQQSKAEDGLMSHIVAIERVLKNLKPYQLKLHAQWLVPILQEGQSNLQKESYKKAAEELITILTCAELSYELSKNASVLPSTALKAISRSTSLAGSFSSRNPRGSYWVTARSKALHLNK